MDDIGLIAIAFVGITPGIIALLLQRRYEIAKVKKTEAEVDTEAAQMLKIATDAGELNIKTAMGFITPLREKIVELEKELKSVAIQLQAIEVVLKVKEDHIEILDKESKKKDRLIFELQAKIKALEGEVEYLKSKVEGLEHGRFPE